MRLIFVFSLSLLLTACLSDEGARNIYAYNKPIQLFNESGSETPINQQEIKVTYYPETTNNPFYDEQIDEIIISSENKAKSVEASRPTPVATKATKTSNTTKKPTSNQTASKKSPTKKPATKAPTIKGKVNCSKFSNHAAAQVYFEARKPGWKGLDRDGDGIACEHL